MLTLHRQLAHQLRYWAEEFAVPHRILTEAGFTVDIAAPVGGKPAADPVSLRPEAAGPEAEAFAAYIDAAAEALANPTALSDVNTPDYDAIFVPVGHGPMEDLAHDPDLGRILVEADAAGKIIAPVCHGPAALLSANLPGGRWLFAGRTLTMFTNEEERLNGTADQAPWLVETVLKARGAVVRSADKAWNAHVVVDGNLYSGQNPASTSRWPKVSSPRSPAADASRRAAPGASAGHPCLSTADSLATTT
ncbi:type 1 glutamine amidotransferase domain-containing protein [Streptomyces sp. NPDC005195]|uniref:type 1 glutamine amidotransferase domain-containing protein n=1 Tax=Streptomyces sp. NPDC005195 TaxID=3154561 RepID=UPI0033BDACE1